MSVSPLFDSIILVYAYDSSEGKKHEICKKMVETVFSGESQGTVSNQILAELYNVLTRETRVNIAPEEARDIIKDIILSKKWAKINYTQDTLLKAITSSSVYKTPFWDSLIAETAKENGILTIITENKKDFKPITGIKVINPFE